MSPTVLNPATEEPIAELEQAGVEETDEAVSRALETGVLSVNSNSSVRVQTPFGVFKPSAFGRELGMEALDGYSEVKSVFISTEEA
jgi:acyl-CoA reductase-like NAD-dependent aldehyde dehydrogenase